MPEIDLATLPVDQNYRDALAPEPGISGSDYGRAAAAGAYGVVGSAAAGVDYLADSDDDSALKKLRHYADEGAKAQVQQMTPAARDALNAGFLPGSDKSIWSPDVSIGSSLGLKLANASPSLLASIIPGGLVAGVARGALTAGAAAAAGTAASGTVNAAMMGGQVYDDIEKSILDAKDDELKAGSPVYNALRKEYSESVSKKVLVETAAGNKPLLAAAVGALTDQFGAAAATAKRAVGEAGEGILKGARKGLVEEAANEAAQNSTQEALTQQGQVEASTGRYDYLKILEQAAQGATIGGIMGGAVGGVTGIGGRQGEGDAGSQRVPVADQPAVTAPQLDPAVTAAAGGRADSRAALDAADEAMSALDKMRQPAVDPAIAAAVKGNDQIDPRSSFEPQNEFEADPDRVVPEEPAAPPQEVPAPAQQLQEAAQPAPGAATAPEEQPATGPEQAPAVPPSEATEPASAKSPTATTIDLDTFLDSGQAEAPAAVEASPSPRVLQAVDQPSAAQPSGERATGRISAAEATRIAKGEGDAITLSTNPDDWKKQSDRTSVKNLADAMVRERGDDAPQWARDFVDAYGQKRVGQGPAAKAAREKLLAARQALHDETQARVQQGAARRETSNEARDRQAQEKRYRDGTEAERLVSATSMPKLAERGVPKAVRDYANSLLTKARAAKVNIDNATDDAHILHLKTAQEVARPGSSKEQIQQFIADDFLLRQGAGEEISARRRAEAQKYERSYDEVQREGPEVREGADTSEAYDAQGAHAEVAVELSEPSPRSDVTAGLPKEGRALRIAREIAARRAARTGTLEATQERAGNHDRDGLVSREYLDLVVDPLDQFVVVGKDRASAFKVESRGRRKVAERKAIRVEPTDAQKEAGNYPMEHKRALGLDVSIETPKGATRSGKDPNGKEWSVKMPADYGYIKGTKGVDGDHVDVYLGPSYDNARYKLRGEVFVVNQQNLDGTFDEHKVMLGYQTYDDAMKAYKAGFSDGKGAKRIQSIARFTPDEFKKWISGTIRGPAQDTTMRFEGNVRREVVAREALREDTEHANPKSKAALAREAAAKSKADLIEYFKPGEDVPSYGGGRDRVIAFDPEQRVVRVQAVNENGTLTGRERTHSTMPSPREMARVLAVRQARSRPLPYGRNTPHAREANPEAEAHARELALLLGDEPEVQTGNVIASPRSGAETPILHTATVADYLKNVDHKAAGGIAAQVNPFIARRLAQLIPDVKVHTVSREGMRALTEDLAGVLPTEISGYYDPVTHEIVLRDQDISEAELSHLIIHEGLHAAFMRTIERVPASKRIIRDLMDTALAHYGSSFQSEYGMTNEHEFVSEAMSSRDFQEKLARVPASSSFAGLPSNNLWTHFVATVRRFLGFKPTQTSALDAALRVGAVLTDLRTAYDQPSTPRGAYAMPHALGVDAIREGFSDVKGATRLVGTTRVLRARTLDQIRQGYRNLFPAGDGADHLDKLVGAMQRQNAYVEGKSREADTHVQDFLNLKKADRKVAEDFAVLANDVTMADLNMLKGEPTLEQMQAANKHIYGSDPKKSDVAMAWQSKAQHTALQRRFSALPEKVQDQFIRAAKFYRDTQNETARTFVSSILDQMAPDMNVAQRSEIAAKALAGTLNEEDAKALGNATLYNALKDAGAAQSIKGMYFPLKRNGDYVVRTRDVVGDTMGGKEVEPGVVEFSAGTDKASRKAAETFARATGLKVTRIAKRFYDHQTGELIKAADAEKDSRVAYRVTLQTHGLHMFESAREAERFVRESRRDGDFHAVEDVQRRQDMEARGDLSYSQLSALTRSVDQRDDLTAGQREVLKTAIAQAAIRQMSGNRIQKHSLARKFYAGASEDFGRNMLQYATAQSNYIGKLKYMPGIRDHLAEMETQANSFNADKSQLRKSVFEEVKSRVNANDTGLNKPSAFVRDLMQVAMLSKLAGPSHSIINAAQPLMTTYPVLAGEHGPMSSALELGKAMKDIGAWRTYGTGVTNSYKAVRHLFETSIDTADPVASIRRKLARQPDGASLGRLLTELQERGALGDGAEFEMAAAIASGRGVAGTAIAKADRIFRQAPAAVEAVNRAGSAVAAYRLARRKGQSEEKAIQYAFDTVQKTQFDYSGFNAPPIFNNPALRPFLQFKKYGQAMTELYASMLYRSFKNESMADRKVAIQQFGILFGMHALVAGAFAVPGLELFKAGAMVAAALGVGSGWQDQQRRLKRYVESAAGKDWADIVQSGLVSHVLGVDLSSRMSAADLWTFGEPKKYTGSEIGGWIGNQLLGASFGTLLEMRDGLGAIEDGDYLKGAIKIVPAKALTDIGKAVKGYTSDKVHLSPGEAVAQGLGFKPKRIADQQEKLSDTIADRNKVKSQRDKLRNRYLDAGSAGERLKIRAQILQYNKSAEQRMRLSIPSLDKMRDRDRLEGVR